MDHCQSRRKRKVCTYSYVQCRYINSIYKDYSFWPDSLTSMAATGNSCF
jgi:hypothetical protein